MATNGQTPSRYSAVIGNKKNFWLYDSETGFDLTHPETPQSPPVTPSLTVKTTTAPVTIDPAKSALVIVDMQNFFLRSGTSRFDMAYPLANHSHATTAVHSVDQEGQATKRATSSSKTPFQRQERPASASSG